MPKKAKPAESDLLGQLIETNYLFKELDKECLLDLNCNACIIIDGDVKDSL